MNETELTELLDQFEGLHENLRFLARQLVEQREELLGPGLAKALLDLNAKYIALYETTEKQIAEVKDKITAVIAKRRESFRGDNWQVVYIKPRGLWNDQALQGFAASHPEILAFRKESLPSVMFRPITEKTASSPVDNGLDVTDKAIR